MWLDSKNNETRNIQQLKVGQIKLLHYIKVYFMHQGAVCIVGIFHIIMSIDYVY